MVPRNGFTSVNILLNWVMHHANWEPFTVILVSVIIQINCANINVTGEISEFLKLLSNN